MKKLHYLLLLTILPVAGVIIFQSYWIINTYNINEARFQKEIKSALLSAIEKDMVNQTKDKIPMLDSLMHTSGQIEIIPTINQAGEEEGFEELLDMLSEGDMPNHEGMTIHISDTDGDIIPHEGNPIDGLFPDSTKLMGDTTLIVGSTSEFNMEGSWKDMILSVIADLSGHTIQLESIDSLYKQSLLEKGLDIGYGLALFENDRFISSTSGDTATYINPDTRAAISSIKNQNMELRVVFPEKGSFLLMNMWLTLSSSLLLVILVIGAFIYMLLVIWKQKLLSEMKNDFISNLTHEFKTPIATVSAAVESMLNFGALDDKEKSHRYLNISQKELIRLNTMVEKVLDISAYEKQKVILNKEVLHLSDIAREVVERFSLQKEDRANINVEIMNNIQIFADRMHIQNLINNLLDNAIKYCDKVPVVNVKLHILEGRAELRIKDNGIGIAKEHQKHIFEKFYRAPCHSRQAVKGFGLGLSYVKHVVEQHYGQISIISKPGAGSEFIIQIPLHHESN